MPLLWRRSLQDELRCSFCRKSQDVVGKLISSPSDYPRAYICDECITTCSQIVVEKEDPFLGNSFASEFFAVIEQWITREDAGQDASEQLATMRAMARQMFAAPNSGIS